jgi:hypothetical protein
LAWIVLEQHGKTSLLPYDRGGRGVRRSIHLCHEQTASRKPPALIQPRKEKLFLLVAANDPS